MPSSLLNIEWETKTVACILFDVTLNDDESTFFLRKFDETHLSGRFARPRIVEVTYLCIAA